MGGIWSQPFTETIFLKEGKYALELKSKYNFGWFDTDINEDIYPNVTLIGQDNTIIDKVKIPDYRGDQVYWERANLSKILSFTLNEDQLIEIKIEFQTDIDESQYSFNYTVGFDRKIPNMGVNIIDEDGRIVYVWGWQNPTSPSSTSFDNHDQRGWQNPTSPSSTSFDNHDQWDMYYDFDKMERRWVNNTYYNYMPLWRLPWGIPSIVNNNAPFGSCSEMHDNIGAYVDMHPRCNYYYQRNECNNPIADSMCCLSCNRDLGGN
jgi:hypothetical protein